jgi:hypothetical protein
MRFVVAPAWAALLVLARARAGAAGGRWVTAAVVAAVAGTVFALSWSRPLLASGVVIDAGVVAVVSAFRPASINGCDAPEGSGRYGTAPSEGPFGPGRRSRRGDTM